MEKKVFLGIDVSKKWIDVTIIPAKDLKTRHYERFDNDKAGYKKMISWAKKKHFATKEEMYFCLEHTGAYSLLLSIFLSEKQYNVWVEHALSIKNSIGMKREKNDKLDSYDIAMYAYRHLDKFKNFKTPSKVLLALQNLESFRERLMKTKLILSVASNELIEGIDAESTNFIKENSSKLIIELNNKLKDVEAKRIKLIRNASLVERVIAT